MRFFSSSSVSERLFSLLSPVEIKQPATVVCYLIFILVTLSSLLSGNLVESGGGGKVSDDVSKTLLTKLTGKQAKVFAVGQVSGSLALFISGSSSKTDFSGGYQVTVGTEPADGRFNVDGAVKLSKYTAMTTPTDLMFICSNELITMSKDGVGAIDLVANQFTKLKIRGTDVQSCFQGGNLHLSTSEAKTFYVVDQSSVTKRAFNGDSTDASLGCNPPTKVLGNFCKIGENKISLSTSCSGSRLAGIISGYVGSSHAYLFDGDNTVYYFDASIFGGGGAQVDLKKMDSSTAWFRQSAEVTTPKAIATTSSSFTIGLIVFFILLALALLFVTFVTVYCCFFASKKPPGDAKNKKQMTGKGKAMKEKSKSKVKVKAAGPPPSPSPSSARKKSSKQGGASSRRLSSSKTSGR